MVQYSSLDNFYFTKAGFIVPCTTGSISFISSLIMLSVILKSGKLNTGYHRIMMLMGMADMLSSFAILLSTMPIRSDVIYPFEGPTVGSIGACTAQGLAYFVGSALVVFMNLSLNIYYLLRLRYRVKEATFNKIIFPIMFGADFLVIAVILPILHVKNKLINPSPYESFCTLSVYPRDCEEDEDLTCRGKNEVVQTFEFFTFIMFFSTLIIIFASFGLILLTYSQNVRELRKSRQAQVNEVDRVLVELASSQALINAGPIINQNGGDAEAGEEEQSENVEERYRQLESISQRENHFKTFTAVFTLQAFMYIGAFTITWIFLILTFIGDLENRQWLQALKLIFLPLQGFFNMLIFVYNKVLHIRRECPGTTVPMIEALRLLWTKADDIPEIVKSRLSTGRHSTANSASRFRWLRNGNTTCDPSLPASDGVETRRGMKYETREDTTSYQHVENLNEEEKRPE